MWCLECRCPGSDLGSGVGPRTPLVVPCVSSPGTQPCGQVGEAQWPSPGLSSGLPPLMLSAPSRHSVQVKTLLACEVCPGGEGVLCG